MKNLIIIGAGGLGREVAWLVERINARSPEWNILGFVESDPKKKHQRINGYSVLGGDEVLEEYPDVYVVCAIAAPEIRKKIVSCIQKTMPYVKFATLIDPTAEMSRWVTIGEGTIICAHAIVSVNTTIGSHVIIDWDSTVGHDSVISDFVTAYPSVNISGNTMIGQCSEVGTGTQIIQGKKIGACAIIGAGSVVVKDIPPKCTAVGVPAKPIKFF